MNKPIIETAKEDRRYKLCRCADCGEVGRCTPVSDYYSTPDTGDKLLCETCFGKHTRLKFFRKTVEALREET